MDLFGEPEQQRSSRRAVVVVGALALVAAVALGAWALLRQRSAGEPQAARPHHTPPAPARSTPTPRPGASTGTLRIQANEGGASVSVDGEAKGQAPLALELSPGSHTVRVAKDGFQPWERDVHVVPGRDVTASARLLAEAPRLRVDADVAGASVFVDRRYLGTTPLETRAVEPGPHRLNVSAEGYDPYAQDIVLEGRLREVMVRFKEVRLDEKLPAVHKHGVGSCRGTLLATPSGIRYVTSGSKDGFSAPLSALEPLEVDYLKNNLRVRVRGGKTYNFGAESPDQLLTFQRAVEAARRRL